MLIFQKPTSHNMKQYWKKENMKKKKLTLKKKE